MRVEERVDDRTFGNLIATALRGHVVQYPLQPAQVGNLAANGYDVLECEFVNLRAGIGVSVDEPQQVAQFIDAEASSRPRRTNVNRLR